MHKRLFIPGPVDVAPDVLEKMATPMIGHRSKEASRIQRQISDYMRVIFNTKEEILLSTTSGSGLMEGAVRSCTAKRAAVFAVGAFGKRWYEMAVCIIMCQQICMKLNGDNQLLQSKLMKY